MCVCVCVRVWRHGGALVRALVQDQMVPSSNLAFNRGSCVEHLDKMLYHFTPIVSVHPSVDMVTWFQLGR